ncbi:MAG: rhomboid family intramembrane serine protease [Pseudomonadales bacterium]
MRQIDNAWIRAASIVAGLVTILWLTELANSWTGHRLDVLGIYPREISALPGILLWPFLHGNFQHLMLNTTPLMVLGFFVALRGWAVFLQTCAIIILVGGLGVWLFGRPAFHIGSSGLVFGFFGFLVAVGIYEKSPAALTIATFTIFFYGGLLFGILPVNRFVSFEAHFFGLCAGIMAARLAIVRR